MDLLYEQKDRREEIYQLYQEIFEDPEEFAAYYFREIYPGNQILIAQEKKILGMIHLNPYKIHMGDREQVLHYIVAVAVRQEHRRRGIMAQMLKRCLRDMAERKEPFTYLMPADRAYYEPFGFVFVMDWQTEEVWGREEDSCGSVQPAIEEEYREISKFLTKYVQASAIYTVPDLDYVRRTVKESQSSGGGLMTWKEEGRIRGVFAEGYEGEDVFLRWAFADDPGKMLSVIRNRFLDRKIEIAGGNVTKGKPEPKIMARMVCLEAWEGILKAKGTFSFRLRVEDPLIKENDHVFCFSGDYGLLKITRTQKDGGEKKISVEDLTQVFFGYEADHILEKHPYLKNIIPAGPIYISEEV